MDVQERYPHLLRKYPNLLEPVKGALGGDIDDDIQLRSFIHNAIDSVSIETVVEVLDKICDPDNPGARND